MKKGLFRRKRYIIEKKFQFRYVGFIMLLLLLSTLMTAYTIYHSSRALLGDELAAIHSQGRMGDIIKEVHTRLAINFLIVAVIYAIVGVFASHRIAGPIYRIIKFLDSVTEGNYSQRVKLRKGDELKDLAEAVNRLVSRLDKQKGR